MQPVNQSYLQQNLEKIISDVSDGWGEIKVVSVAEPFSYKAAQNRVEGKIKVDERIIPVYYNDQIQSEQDLENGINIDIAVILFNRLLDRGELRTKHLFKAYTLNQKEVVLIVSKSNNFETFYALPVPLKSVYDLGTGILSIASMDNMIDTVLEEQCKDLLDVEARKELEAEKNYFPLLTPRDASMPMHDELGMPRVAIKI